jgi:NO-binding membrane sensor protein with MHYT domain
MLTVHNFQYGLLTPALGYLMSFLGSFIGLRCTTRARASTGSSRLRWIAFAAVSIGITGIWVMHFIAMLGFAIPGETIRYNVPITLASMLTAVVFVLIGLLIVGLGQQSYRTLLLGGVITGLGVAAMHYSGMAAMVMPGRMSYNPELFAVSVVIAVVAATVALWFTLKLRGFWPTIAASAIMGVAVNGMHYMGMAALHVYRSGTPMSMSGASAESFLLPLIIGISVITFVMTATIALAPTEEELNEDADLMRRIDIMRAQPPTVVQPVISSTSARQSSGRFFTSRDRTSGADQLPE